MVFRDWERKQRAATWVSAADARDGDAAWLRHAALMRRRDARIKPAGALAICYRSPPKLAP
jgi:hypothetical protein